MSFPPTGTVTFLFTDIEGSTKLWEAHPDAMRPALARHDDLLRRSIQEHEGYVFKTVGDAFCAAFPTANQALESALAAQVALAAEPWELPKPLLVRMVLHTGTTEERGGDYFGQPLNRVARLMAAGHGGQVLLSEVTQVLVRDALLPDASLLDLSQHRLKDLGRPEQVFQLLHPSLPAEFPPLRSLDNPALPNNLPQQPTSFIGREKEVAQVKARLARTRLLTLTGAGGSGKTRLSLQVAADLLTGEGDGVWLVELATLSDPALVPQAVANVLGVQEQAGKSIQQTLVEALKLKRLLLVLDNCEHLVSACASLAADLLRACPNVHILASSREPLNVAGEQTYRVPPLSLPDPKQAQTVESLSQFEAVRLFIERAQAVQPSFAVTNRNAPALASVCHHLDGIPLAIELAAARIRSMTVEELETRLADRFRLLTGGSRTALPRQQTLRALIDWSYDLLDDNQKVLLRRLSVFAGGWSLSAAEAVCAGGEVEAGAVQEWEVLDLLTALVDKSLVTVEEQEEGTTRYRLLETVRQYAGDRLQEGGDAEAVGGRAASWFLRLAEEAEPHLMGPEQEVWLSRLETEHDNFRASLSRDLAGGLPGDLAGEEPALPAAGVKAGVVAGDAAGGLRLAGALWWFWLVRGYLSEGRQWLGKALARTQPGADPGANPGADGGAVTAGRAEALGGAALLAADQGDLVGARALHEESLTLYRQLGDQRGITFSLNFLGRLAYDRGDVLEARALHEESLSICRQVGHQMGIAFALRHLGRLAADQGDVLEARALQEESLSIQRRLGNQRGIAFSLHGLGNVAAAQGDLLEARALQEESLSIHRQLGDQGGIAACLEGLSDIAQEQSQPSRAVRLEGAASSLRESIGSLPSPVDQQKRDKTRASLREVLGATAFAAAWDAGRAMTPEQAVEYALSGALGEE